MVVPICYNCGCKNWGDCHGDVRNVTSYNINGALSANSKVTPAEMVANIKEGLDTWLNQVTGESTAKKSDHLHPHPHAAEPVYSYPGYTYSVSIEPV